MNNLDKFLQKVKLLYGRCDLCASNEVIIDDLLRTYIIFILSNAGIKSYQNNDINKIFNIIDTYQEKLYFLSKKLSELSKKEQSQFLDQFNKIIFN